MYRSKGEKKTNDTNWHQEYNLLLKKYEHEHQLVIEKSKRIKELEEQLAKVEELRQEKMQEVMEIRKFRKGLEKIRENDKVEFVKEQERLEQIDLDDKTSVRYARNILQKA